MRFSFCFWYPFFCLTDGPVSRPLSSYASAWLPPGSWTPQSCPHTSLGHKESGACSRTPTFATCANRGHRRYGHPRYSVESGGPACHQPSSHFSFFLLPCPFRQGGHHARGQSFGRADREYGVLEYLVYRRLSLLAPPKLRAEELSGNGVQSTFPHVFLCASWNCLDHLSTLGAFSPMKHVLGKATQRQDALGE